MVSSQELLSQLNDNQRAAVEYCDGPQLVIAGAGSGKTRVLTYKIAYLLANHKMQPWNILALTFTNKAAREMKERIARLVGEEQARYLNMGTFHSIFSHILRREAEVIGYTSNFTIYDQSDSRSLLKAIVKEMGLDEKNLYKPSSVADTISMAKNHLVGPEAFYRSSLFDHRKSKVVDIYRTYVNRCRQANAMDFDDLLVLTFRLFREHEDIRKKYVERFRYVLVDEYQDTNHVQQSIVIQLTKEHQHICVVGDDAQSIYSFRGANIDNILSFQDNFENTRLFKLEQNYRSTQLIVQAANSLIRKNAHQIPKDVFSKNDHGEQLILKPSYSDKEESIIVCQDIQRIRRQEKLNWCDFAVLYRTNSQSRSFEEQMRKDNIPYRIYGGLSFYQRKEIKDVIAYFRVVVNPNDEEALKRIINYPTRGIGGTTLSRIVETASQHGVSLWQVISQPVLFQLNVSKGTATKIAQFCQLIEGWMQRADKEDAYQLGYAIIQESGISRDIYSGRDPEDLSRQENLEELVGGLNDFVESHREEGQGDHVAMGDFLQEISLMTDLDSDHADDNDRVALMTIHAAKGLEFPTVFIVGLEENIFPSPMCTGTMKDLEEERRLLYVAITRAERHCILTCAQNRFRYGKMEYDTPSRFIKDIDPSLITVMSERSEYGGDSYHSRQQSRWTQNPRPVASQFRADPMPRAVAPREKEKPVNSFSDSFANRLDMARSGSFKPISRVSTSASSPSTSTQAPLREGNVIEHQRFGIGTVVKLEGEGENRKATVEFRNTGTKQLLLKFARYSVIK